MYIYEDLIKKVPIPQLPPYLNKKNPFILQITNETRQYILASKTRFDLEEWFTAICAQIETIKSNNQIKQTRKNIQDKEKEIAVRDHKQVQNFTKLISIT